MLCRLAGGCGLRPISTTFRVHRGHRTPHRRARDRHGRRRVRCAVYGMGLSSLARAPDRHLDVERSPFALHGGLRRGARAAGDRRRRADTIAIERLGVFAKGRRQGVMIMVAPNGATVAEECSTAAAVPPRRSRSRCSSGSAPSLARCCRRWRCFRCRSAGGGSAASGRRSDRRAGQPRVRQAGSRAQPACSGDQAAGVPPQRRAAVAPAVTVRYSGPHAASTTSVPRSLRAAHWASRPRVSRRRCSRRGSDARHPSPRRRGARPPRRRGRP